MQSDNPRILTPPLLIPPLSSEGWYEWVRQEMEQLEPGFKMPGQNSISGQLILRDAPTWAQQKAVLQALQGENTAAGAVALREQFLAGQPLSLLPLHCTEVYRTFVPVISRIENDVYQVGQGTAVRKNTPSPAALAPDTETQLADWPASVSFKAKDPAEALTIARYWYYAQRNKEIGGLLTAARDASRSFNPFHRDILAKRLKVSGKLTGTDATGQEVTTVYSNGAHDRYVILGSGYTYGFSASSTVAAVAGFMVAKSLKIAVAPPSAEDIPMVGPPSWKTVQSNELRYTWAGGMMNQAGVMKHGDKIVGKVAYGNGKLTLFNKDKTVIAEIPTARPDELLFAWAASKVLGRIE